MKKDFLAYLKFFRDNNRYIYIQDIKLQDALYLFSAYVSDIYQSLISGARDKKLLPLTIIEKIDYFRKMRNLIHINALLSHSLEDTYRELDSAFLYTKEIFDCIEDMCTETV